MPATSAIDLRANVDLWGSKGEHKELPGHRPERPEAPLWRPGRRPGRAGREVGPELHALPPKDAEGHRHRGLRLLGELQIGVEDGGGAVSLQEGHR